MEHTPLWELAPVLSQHTFWLRKERFSLAEDLYEEWVIFAVEDGSFRYSILGQEGTASFGDIVLCPPGAVFQREVVSPLTFHYFRFRLFGANGQPADSRQVRAGKISFRDSERLVSDYAQIKKVMNPSDPFHLPRVNLLLTDIWHLYGLESRQEAAEETRKNDPAMDRAAVQLEVKASESFMMRTLSQSYGLSPVQFTRRFQTAHGISPSEYLINLRLKKASVLLSTTDMTIEEIASECGYQNGFYLSRLFSRRMKMSPSEYRRTHRV